jgi:chromosome segregation ATPase
MFEDILGKEEELELDIDGLIEESFEEVFNKDLKDAMDDNIKQKEELIKKLIDDLEERDQEIKELKEIVTELEGTVDEKDKELDEKDKEIFELEETVDKLTEEKELVA